MRAIPAGTGWVATAHIAGVHVIECSVVILLTTGLRLTVDEHDTPEAASAAAEELARHLWAPSPYAVGMDAA